MLSTPTKRNLGLLIGVNMTKDEAISYAKSRVKTFRDSLDGVEIWLMPNGSYDVNHTMNSNGRNWNIDHGGKEIQTIYKESLVWKTISWTT